MRFPTMLLSTACAAILAHAMPAMAQDPAHMNAYAEAVSEGGDRFSGAVLVARDGQVLLDHGYGYANREWQQRNDGDTRFRLGSVTKQFTAASILLLHDRGRINLDAPVKTYLPYAPAAWDAVTVRHLLNHTAGIPNFTSFDDYAAQRTQPTDLAALVGRFRDRPLDFAPGTRFAYSNSGYVVLTDIVERVSGQSYADFVTANLFQPLAMQDSGYDNQAAIIPHRAAGYAPAGSGIVNAPYTDMSIPQGAGGLYSTSKDMLKWITGLFQGRLLRPETLRLMVTPAMADYGFGLMIRQQDGHTLYSHSGAIEGFNSFMAYDPEQKLAVVVLGNLNGRTVDRLGYAMVQMGRGEALDIPAPRTSLTLSAEQLRAYEGHYQLAPGFGIDLRVEGERLMAHADGKDPIALNAEAPDRFALPLLEVQLVFTRDASGTVTGLSWHQSGREIPAMRQPLPGA